MPISQTPCESMGIRPISASGHAEERPLGSSCLPPPAEVATSTPLGSLAALKERLTEAANKVKSEILEGSVGVNVAEIIDVRRMVVNIKWVYAFPPAQFSRLVKARKVMVDAVLHGLASTGVAARSIGYELYGAQQDKKDEGGDGGQGGAGTAAPVASAPALPGAPPPPAACPLAPPRARALGARPLPRLAPAPQS